MNIALAQVNPTVSDLEGNRELILEYARQAHDRGADLVAAPEPHAAALLHHTMHPSPKSGFAMPSLADIR